MTDESETRFLRLLQAHQKIVLKVASVYCWDAAERDDLRQETLCIRCMRALDPLSRCRDSRCRRFCSTSPRWCSSSARSGQLRVLSTIDYGEALVTIQSMLTELGVRRAREVRWQWLLMLSYSLLWSCGRRDASTTVRMELRKRWPTTSRDPLRASCKSETILAASSDRSGTLRERR